MPNLSLCLKHRLSHFRKKNYLLFLFSQNSKHKTSWEQLILGMDGQSFRTKVRRPFLHFTNMNFSGSSESSTYSKKPLHMEIYVFLREKIFLQHGASFEINSSEVSMTYSSSLIYTCEHSSSMISAGNGFLNKTDESHHFTTYLPSQMLTVKTP